MGIFSSPKLPYNSAVSFNEATTTKAEPSYLHVHFFQAQGNVTLPDLNITDSALSAFCRRWKIAELSLFGSALRDDFGSESDIDLLVTFTPNARWSLLDHIRMEEEARSLFGRGVDLVTRRAVERSRNPIRREAILGNSRMIYAAG